MKVVITEDFREQYEALFTELQTMVDGNDLNIDVEDLPTFFAALDGLREKSQSVPFKYLRLPLEEPAFKVDMDSRVIEVPTVFKNNGLGVKGDTNAEIVFFEIDRYYDGMDLNVLDCVVQWSNASNKVESNKQNTSTTILCDATEEKVLVGWVITNSMTEQSGTLDFALRFFKRDGGKISYSIATQKASCPIKPSLDFDMSKVEEDKELENLILTRPIYSGIINSMNGAAPTIVSNILDNLGDKAVDGQADLTKDYADYDDYEEKAPAGILKLKVEAKSPDNGELVYRWYNNSNQLMNFEGTGLAAENEYIVTTAGRYTAQIGNQKSATGTRWLWADTVVVPSATELNYGNTELFPLLELSNGKQSLVFDVTGYNKAEDVKYSWTLDGQLITDGVTGNTYKPPVKTEGEVACTAVNNRNNTASKPLTTPNVCLLRAEPDRPTKVVMTWDGGTQSLTVTPTFPVGSPSAKHSDEWNVSWTREILNESAVVLPDKSTTITPILQRPTQEGTYREYMFTANVNHVVLPNTAIAKNGETRRSNVITLRIYSDGSITEIKDEQE